MTILQSRWWKVGAVALLATSWLWGATATLVAPSISGAVGTEVKASLRVRGAQGLGSLQLDLTFDPALLEAQGVAPGEMLPGALLAFNVVEPGRLRIALTGDPQRAANGDGSLVEVTFRVLAAGECALRIESARAWEQTIDAPEMLLSLEPGRFAAGTAWWTDWKVLAAIAVVALALLVLLVRLVSRRRGRPAPAPAQWPGYAGQPQPRYPEPAPPPPVATPAPYSSQAPVAQSPPAFAGDRFCGGCGAALGPNAAFCPGCGRPVGGG
jgi:hypothetical protein